MDYHYRPDAPPQQRAQGGVHEKALEFAATCSRGRLLDVPAGEGALSVRFRDLGFEVVAADVGADFKIDDIPFLRLDLDQLPLPFADASFDVLACIEGIEHTENPYGVIREYARILRPGGNLILSTPNVLNIRSRIRFFFGSHHRRFKDIDAHGHLTPLSYRELKYAFDKASLSVRDIGTNSYRPKWPLVYPLLKALIRAETRRRHPLADVLTTPELLDGQILVVLCEKPGPA